ncbi:hypothetical protein P3T35_005621 [Kitasatospora sp. GP30]|uniref:RICIN domain-containing protein n=1 Tax=Kitasatospora sp. GP30 TaxID=3035084 RepID=UPI000C6FEC82|nr:RICIN domain-containing protein [Kitasatospora sp. GP30]MDH6143586.1 hypothetical protein [Kitasatospora sp. GP30]
MRAFSRLKQALRHRAIAAVLLMALAMAGVGGLAAPQRAAAAGANGCAGQDTPGGGNCISALINSIFGEINVFVSAAQGAKSDNAKFTQDAVTQFQATAPGYNILVFKYDGTDAYDTKWFVNPYTANMHGVLLDTTFKLQHHDSEGGPFGYDDFRLWIFKDESTFTNKGDGGYSNWAFVGSDGETDTVRHPPCGKIACSHTDRTLHFPARSTPQQTNSLSPDASPGHHACLDVDQNGTANGTPIQLWDCHGGGNQSWTYNGFQLRANGKCLDLPGDNTTQGTKLQLWDCVEVASQRWYLTPDGTFRHMEDPTDRSKDVCIDVPNGVVTNGTRLQVWGCGSAANGSLGHQSWHWGGVIAGGGGGTGDGGKVIDGTPYLRLSDGLGAVVTGSNAGASVVAGIRGGSDSKWQFTSLGGGRYKITNVSSGLALTENTGSYLAETQPWNGADEQKWELVSAGNGTYQLRISSDDCLTYDEDFKTLGVWTCKSGWTQQWALS